MAQTFEARAPVNFSIVSQRRVYAPGGLNGGGDGAKGINTIFRKEASGYTPINVSSNGMAKMAKGDRVQIATPGGGGWGKPLEV
jgi:5-oxoprolinase (ATP-hydrolysing)